MKKSSNLLHQLLGIGGLVFLAFVIIFIFQWSQENLIASGTTTLGSQAYPYPNKLEPTKFNIPIHPHIQSLITHPNLLQMP